MSFSIAQDLNSRFRPQGFSVLRPTNPIAGLQPNLWLDASNTTTLVVTADPDVDRWNDISVDGNNVSESTASEKPHTGTATIGTLNAVEFDGTDDGLANNTAGGTFNGNSGDIYAIVELDNVSSFQYILASSDLGSLDGVFAAHFSNAGTVRIGTQISGSANILRGGTTLSTSTPYLVRFFSTGSAYGVEVNGVAETLSADPSFPGSVNNGDWFGDLATRDNMTIGHLHRSNGRTGFLDGTLGEIVYFDNKVLTAIQSDAVSAYLMAKWRI